MPIYLIYMNGLILGLSLIMSLGPQNIFLIRQAAMRRHALLSAITCFICDTVLITTSVTGLNQAISNYPSIRISMIWFGSAFLLYYGTMTLITAYGQKKCAITIEQPLTTRWKIILLALGFSLLNPQAIIDSLILIGGGSTQFPEHKHVFLYGVITSSLIWFTLITSITHYFSNTITRTEIWRCIESVSGLIMVTIGIKLIYNG